MENHLDKFCFRLAIVISASFFNVELGISDPYAIRLFTIDFYKEYLIVTLISLTVFELIYLIHKRLDKNFPVHGPVICRLFLQTAFCGLVPILLIFGGVTLCNHFYTIDIQRTIHLAYTFHYVVLWLILLNTILLMTPPFLISIQHRKDRQSESLLYLDPTRAPINQVRRQLEHRVKVQDGKSFLMLKPTEIVAVYSVNKRILIRGINGKECLTDLTLAELEKIHLPSVDFYRINRQLIASRTSIIECKPLHFNKIEVVLSFPVPVSTIVSQLKSKSFKQWIY